MLLMFSVVVPVLVRSTGFALLVEPMTIVPNAIDVGDTVTVGAEPVTVNEIVVVAVIVPEVPVIVTVDVPIAAVELAVRVSVVVVVPGFGLKPAVTPLGRPEALKVTLPLKPFTGAIVMVLVPLNPSAMLRELGLALKLKPAAAATFTTIVFDEMPLVITDRL